MKFWRNGTYIYDIMDCNFIDDVKRKLFVPAFILFLIDWTLCSVEFRVNQKKYFRCYTFYILQDVCLNCVQLRNAHNLLLSEIFNYCPRRRAGWLSCCKPSMRDQQCFSCMLCAIAFSDLTTDQFFFLQAVGHFHTVQTFLKAAFL